MSVSNRLILGCDACGHRQLAAQPTDAELSALYSQEYFSSGTSSGGGYASYTTNELGWRRTARRRLTFVRRYAHSSAMTLLDVGAAAGYFVAEAIASGWSAEGVEPSPWAVKIANEDVRVPVVCGTLATVPETRSFDVISAWEVIEHVRDPLTFLLDARARLSPEGLLALSTPVTDTLVPQLLGARWIGWEKVPEHLSFFSRTSLLRLMARAGFRPVWQRLEPVYVTLGYLWERLHRQLTGRSLSRPWPSRLDGTVGVNPGWDLMLLARRD